MIRQLLSCLGWVASEAVPMSERGLVDWEAENETHVGAESRRVIEDIFGDDDVVYQDRYFGPMNSVGRLVGSSPQDAGAETPVEVAAPAASTGPYVPCVCGNTIYRIEEGGHIVWRHVFNASYSCATPIVSPAPDGSQQLGDEIRGAVGAAETDLSGGGTNRPTSVLLLQAAHQLEHDVEERYFDWALIAELRARAAELDSDAIQPNDGNDALRRAFGLTPDDPIPNFPT